MLGTALGIVGAVSGITALIVSGYQAQLAKRATSLQAVLPMYELYQSPAFRQTRAKLYRRELSFKTLSFDEEQDLRTLINHLEFLRTLVELRIVGFNVVHDLYRKSPPLVWREIERTWVRMQREGALPEPNPGYARNFEKLMRRYDRTEGWSLP